MPSDPVVLWAYGASDEVSYHVARGVLSIDLFLSGASGIAPGALPGDGGSVAAVAHGGLMLLSWGVLIPFGIGVARFSDKSKASWFRVHVGLQISGLLVAAVGIAVALFVLAPVDTLHGSLGLAVMSVGLLQPLNAIVRPHKGGVGQVRRLRTAWEVVHKWSGRGAALLALPVVYLGIRLLSLRLAEPLIFIVGSVIFSVYLVALAAVFIFLTCSAARTSSPLIAKQDATEPPGRSPPVREFERKESRKGSAILARRGSGPEVVMSEQI